MKGHRYQSYVALVMLLLTLAGIVAPAQTSQADEPALAVAFSASAGNIGYDQEFYYTVSVFTHRQDRADQPYDDQAAAVVSVFLDPKLELQRWGDGQPKIVAFHGVCPTVEQYRVVCGVQTDNDTPATIWIAVKPTSYCTKIYTSNIIVQDDRENRAGASASIQLDRQTICPTRLYLPQVHQ